MLKVTGASASAWDMDAPSLSAFSFPYVPQWDVTQHMITFSFSFCRELLIAFTHSWLSFQLCELSGDISNLLSVNMVTFLSFYCSSIHYSVSRYTTLSPSHEEHKAPAGVDFSISVIPFLFWIKMLAPSFRSSPDVEPSVKILISASMFAIWRSVFCLISPRILRILTGYYDRPCSSSFVRWSFVRRRSFVVDVTLFLAPHDFSERLKI